MFKHNDHDALFFFNFVYLQGVQTKKNFHTHQKFYAYSLTLLHSERPKLHTILAFLSAIGLK